MSAKVAVVEIKGDYAGALRQAIELLGGLGDLNSPERDVTIKVGIFDHRSRHHASPEALRGIIAAFDQAPRIRLAESDSYCGQALDRLAACYSDLFSERVQPFSLSDDPELAQRSVAGVEMGLSPALFKPNVLVDVHILRTFTRGSILKNLFGCTPMVQKAKFHKNEVFNALLADIFETCGGIDLAVMDGTYIYHNATEKHLPVGLLLVGKDAVAVEAVGAALAGLKPEKCGALPEFVRRGLGEGDLEQIEVVGIPKEDFAAFGKVRRALKKLVDEAPRLPGISDTIDALAEEGWLDSPRTAEEVTAELVARGVSNAKKTVVETTLKRRAGKTLEQLRPEPVEAGAAGQPPARNGGWVYQRRQG